MALDWNGLRFNSVDTSKTSGLGAIGKSKTVRSNLGDIRAKAQANSVSGRSRNSPIFNHYDDSFRPNDNLAAGSVFDKKPVSGRQNIGISGKGLSEAIKLAQRNAALKTAEMKATQKAKVLKDDRLN